MLNTVKGDLIAQGRAGQYDIIVQGCNCHNAMGSGIARQIRAEFPDAWLADQHTLMGDRNKLGRYTIGMSGRLVIVNAYTQYNTAKFAGEDVFEYASFAQITDSLTARFGKYRIGIPLIGMGLAGGDPARIMPMLNSWADSMTAEGGSLTLVEYSRD